MQEQEQTRLFCEDENDALDAAIRCLGGYKHVGMTLWPHLKMETAYARLKAALNPSKDEKLAFGEGVLIMRLAREKGCHTLMHYIADECLYEKPRPIEPEDKLAELERKFIAAVEELGSIKHELTKRGFKVVA